MTNTIQHRGVVEKVSGSLVYVRIVQASACAGCSAKGYCSSADSKEKIIEIEDSSRLYQVGEEVWVIGTVSTGMRAVLVAFFLPFVFLIIVLFVSMLLSHGDEILSGSMALGSLIPYYIIIYFNRNRLKKKLSFVLKPINH